MRWNRTGNTGQVEDRRGQGGAGGLGGLGGGLGGALGGAFGGGRRGGGGKLAGGGIGITGIIIALLFTVCQGGGGSGFDVNSGLSPFDQTTRTGGSGSLNASPSADDVLAAFVSFVVQDVQASWDEQFRAAGQTYQPTKLVIFEDATSTGCGQASSATGPFYCPPDGMVYLDLGFFRELQTRFGAPGDFAQAYVIAHEFGHHVQNILGTGESVRAEQQRRPNDANELSVRLELQADCFAGVWAHSAYEDNLLESGDLEEGLSAAAAVGDDRIQQQAGARVNPESFTHGTSQQRQSWFKKGYETGKPSSCNTFA